MTSLIWRNCKTKFKFILIIISFNLFEKTFFIRKGKYIFKLASIILRIVFCKFWLTSETEDLTT